MTVVLGLESSCDETAIALVNDQRSLLFHRILSQKHTQYGGVIPEIAARQHIDILPGMLADLFREYPLRHITAIAVTAGPGLIGGLIVGTTIAKAIASAAAKPCIPINHLEAHALTPRLSDASLNFPYLLLLVSGGHTQILKVHNVGQYSLLGQSVDDAAGEAFDKVAKILGLPYPGGPAIENLALSGNPHAYRFPQAFSGQLHCNFSFSGLKTAVLRQVERIEETGLTVQRKADLCASFQYAVSQIILDRLTQAHHQEPQVQSIAIAGGVAANKYLRERITAWANQHGCNLYFPSLDLCTDNGAMVAWAGVERLSSIADNVSTNQYFDMTFAPRSSWPLAELTELK